MEELLHNIEEIKGFIGSKHHSDETFHEHPSSRSNGSLSSRLNKHASSFHQGTQNSVTFPGYKNVLIEEIPSNPSFVYQISTEYLLKFFGLLHRKFKYELNFHQIYSQEISSLKKDCQPHRKELQIINHMIHFDCFTIINKKENPNFLKIENIIQRIRQINAALEELVSFVRIANPLRPLIFCNENECKTAFLKIFPEASFQNEYFSKICSEAWRFIKQTQCVEPTETNIQIPFENLKLFVYGISFPTPNLEDFPLHHAVYTSNLPMIRKICARENSPIFYSHVEQGDPAGVTALMLAVLVGNKDAALILTNHGADPKHRSYPYARTPLEEAVKRKKRGLIKTLLVANNHMKQTQWEENKKPLIELLKKLPDFSFEMSWECDSKIIPFVKRIAPSDTYKVYKLGSSLRIDLSLLGWSKFQSVRGNSSIVFNGSGAEEGRLTMIDHSREVAADIFEDINSLSLDNKIEELIKHEQLCSEIRAENVVFKPALTWKGEPITQVIENYPTVKYHAKGTFSLMFTKRNILVDVDIDMGSFKSFKEYFEYVLKESLWIFHDNTRSIDSFQTPIGDMIHYIECYQAAVKSILNKEDTARGKDRESDKGLKGKQEADKMNMAQKSLLKNYSKNVVASVYMCEKFPLSLEHLMPVLEILSNVSPHINKLKGFLERQSTINKHSFPLKACIPILFSVNAILCTKNFKFSPPDRSLFDLEKLVRHRSIPKKRLDPGYREDKFRTEGGSDDEQAKKCWEDLLKNTDEDIVPYAYIDFENKDCKDSKYTNGELDESVESTKPVTQPFIKKNKTNLSLRNLIKGVGNEDNNGLENLEDCEISEKYNDDSLRLNSHPTYIPKTISSIQQKFRHQTEADFVNPNPMYIPEDQKVIRSIHTLKARNSYKFLESLNQTEKSETARSRHEDVKDTKSSNRERLFESNSREPHIKKMLKYTIKDPEVFMKNFEKPQQVKEEYKIMPQEKSQVDSQKQAQLSFSKKGKHPRIKSVDSQLSQKKVNPLFIIIKNNWKGQL